MLEITIPKCEKFNEDTLEFINIKEQTLKLEHSLVSISKWESKWKKPFFSSKSKTLEETRDYVKCMTLTQNVDPIIYYGLTNQNVKEITDYMEDSMTATWFNDTYTDKSKKSSEQVTSELIYYWMISLQIPMECQKWHINRLFTLIKVCQYKNNPPKKMSQKELAMHNKKLNDARKKAMHTNG